jgi:hypothetical protein
MNHSSPSGKNFRLLQIHLMWKSVDLSIIYIKWNLPKALLTWYISYLGKKLKVARYHQPVRELERDDCSCKICNPSISLEDQ